MTVAAADDDGNDDNDDDGKEEDEVKKQENDGERCMATVLRKDGERKALPCISKKKQKNKKE